MKKIYKDGDDRENNLIKKRLKRMSTVDLFRINGDKITEYIMNDKNISYKKFNFPDGNKNGIAVFINNMWLIHEFG